MVKAFLEIHRCIVTHTNIVLPVTVKPYLLGRKFFVLHPNFAEVQRGGVGVSYLGVQSDQNLIAAPYPQAQKVVRCVSVAVHILGRTYIRAIETIRRNLVLWLRSGLCVSVSLCLRVCICLCISAFGLASVCVFLRSVCVSVCVALRSGLEPAARQHRQH